MELRGTSSGTPTSKPPVTQMKRVTLTVSGRSRQHVRVSKVKFLAASPRAQTPAVLISGPCSGKQRKSPLTSRLRSAFTVVCVFARMCVCVLHHLIRPLKNNLERSLQVLLQLGLRHALQAPRSKD